LVRILNNITQFSYLGRYNVVQYSWSGFPDPRYEATVYYTTVVFPATISVHCGSDAIDLLLNPAKMASSSRGIYELPSMYYGVVSRSVVNRICIGGKPFHTQVPDWFSMTALSATLAEYYLSSVPLFIVGRSAKSNTGKFVEKKRDSTHSEEYGDLERMDRLTPPVNTIEVYHFDPVLKGIRAMGTNKQMVTFERRFLPMTYALSILRNRSAAAKLFRHLWREVLRTRKFADRATIIWGIIFHMSRRIWQRVLDRIEGEKAPAKWTQSRTEVSDISEAVQILEQTAVGWPAEPDQLLRLTRQ